MIVPFVKAQAKGQAPQQSQPSETDMLMALATMHQMGRIPSTGSNENRFGFGIRREDKASDPYLSKGKIIDPGDSIPDRERGGTQARDVRAD